MFDPEEGKRFVYPPDFPKRQRLGEHRDVGIPREGGGEGEVEILPCRVVFFRQAGGRPGNEGFHALSAGTGEHQTRVEVRVAEEGLFDMFRLVLALQFVHVDGQQAGEGQEGVTTAVGEGAEGSDERQEGALGQTEVGRLAHLEGEPTKLFVTGDELADLRQGDRSLGLQVGRSERAPLTVFDGSDGRLKIRKKIICCDHKCIKN